MILNARHMFNLDLGKTADAIREAVHNFASNEIAPRAAVIDRSSRSAVTATSRTTPPAGCCMTPSSTRTAPGAARFVAC